MAFTIAVASAVYLTPLHSYLWPPRADAAVMPVQPEGLAVEAAPSDQPRGGPRLYYLDNLKSCLTLLVVVHHTLGAFGGIGSLGLSVGNFRNPVQVFTGILQVLSIRAGGAQAAAAQWRQVHHTGHSNGGHHGQRQHNVPRWHEV